MINSRHFGYPVQAAAFGMVNTILQLVQALGVRMDASQNAAVTALVNAMWVLLMALLAKQKNGPPAAP